MKYTAAFTTIKADFRAHKIPIDAPGFYDHPNFLKVERKNPNYLKNYARYVHDRPRTATYDEYVKKTVPIVSGIFHKHLKLSGRLGACVDISSLLSRALEREGIWNFVVKGSLTIEFPKKTGILPKYFWSVDFGEFTAAHAWVVAPPFYVVDISVQLQPYSHGEEEHLPQIVCDEAGIVTNGTLDDVVSPDVRAILSSRGVPESDQLRQATPETPTFMKIFPARLLHFCETTMKYVPVAGGAPDCPFEEMTAMLFNGKTGYEIYMSEIKPALAKVHKGV